MIYLFYKNDGSITTSYEGEQFEDQNINLPYVISEININFTDYYVLDGVLTKKPVIEIPINKQKEATTILVNKLASDKILTIYPMYKQINLGRTPDSTEAVTMYAYIDLVRSLSNLTNTIINSSTTVESVRDVVESFKLQLH